jgi:tetratricopeptide (TPR) repeat protein
MKKILRSLIFICTFIQFGCNLQNNNTTQKVSSSVIYAQLKERNSELSKLPDWNTVKMQANALYSKIQLDTNDNASKILLAQLYMQEARITGEHPYYYPASIALLDGVLKQDASNFEALVLKSSVLLSLHHFSEALELGNKARSINPNNGFIYGVLCDANVELGNYEEAVQMSDMMQSIRPGLESYSRASYLREIYGNNQGAIEAMKLAFQAGLPGSEEASWAGNTLVHLLENTNDLKHAEELANIILEQRPSYAFATDALGRIELAKGNYEKAINHFDNAIKIMPEFSFYENKAELYTAMGQNQKAIDIYKEVLTMLSEDSKSGHYVDLELSHVYLKLGDYNNALKHANIEYKRRPLNIDVNKAMAWVYYSNGNPKVAKKFMDVAMRMGTQNAELLAMAAIIEEAAGNIKIAQNYKLKYQKLNAYISKDISDKLKV